MAAQVRAAIQVIGGPLVMLEAAAATLESGSGAEWFGAQKWQSGMVETTTLSRHEPGGGGAAVADGAGLRDWRVG